MKIVVVEDEQFLAKQIQMVLKKEGYNVDIFFDAETFLDKFDKQTDILILDINLPGMNGTDLFNILKDLNINIRTIFVTSYNDIKHMSKAFNLGAEDYLKKPFDLEELLLRVRRVKNAIYENSNDLIKFKNYNFDLKNYRVIYDSDTIQLTKQETKLMKIFLNNLDKVITFDFLNEEVWDNLAPNNTIIVSILRLKKKLELKELKNIREIGYILNK